MPRNCQPYRTARVYQASLVVIVAGGLLANALTIWSTDQLLQKRLAEIRASGAPVTLADLERPPIADDQNAATYFKQAEPDIDELILEAANLSGDDGAQLEFPLSKSNCRKLELSFEKHARVFPLLEQAAACPDFRVDLDCRSGTDAYIDSGLNLCMRQHHVSQFLELRANCFNTSRHHDQALQTAILMLRLADRNEQVRLMLAYLNAGASRNCAMKSVAITLYVARFPEESHVELETTLAKIEETDRFLDALQSERAYLISSSQEESQKPYWLLQRPCANLKVLAWIDFYFHLLESYPTLKCYAQIKPSVENFAATVWAKESEFGVHILGPPWVLRGRTRALRILNALHRHGFADAEILPDLSKLGLPPETLIDPFDGQPMRIKRLPTGWAVYSVGLNMVDDGGKIDDLYEDIGVGPPGS